MKVNNTKSVLYDDLCYADYSTVMDVTSRMNILKLIFALEIFDHTS